MPDSTPIGNAAPFAMRMIAEGVGATEGLRMLRDSGVGIRTQTWYRVYGEAQASLANTPMIEGLNRNRRPGDEMFTDWSAGTSGRYAYQVTVLTFDAETGMTGTRLHTIITNQVITPANAEGQALGQLNDANDDPRYSSIALGAVTTGLYRMVGPA